MLSACSARALGHLINLSKGRVQNTAVPTHCRSCFLRPRLLPLSQPGLRGFSRTHTRLLGTRALPAAALEAPGTPSYTSQSPHTAHPAASLPIKAPATFPFCEAPASGPMPPPPYYPNRASPGLPQAPGPRKPWLEGLPGSVHQHCGLPQGCR